MSITNVNSSMVNSSANNIALRSNTSEAKAGSLSNASTENIQGNSSVKFTDAAQHLQGIQAKISSLPEVDMDKVNSIKAAIADGSYKIDPERLANNIANFEGQLASLA